MRIEESQVGASANEGDSSIVKWQGIVKSLASETDTPFGLVPASMATMAPFLPFAALLVSIV